jgi:threonine synthase
MWRYAEALPVFAQRISLGEVLTPLVPCRIGESEVLLKCEYSLPTGSYKDRGSALLISYLRSLGVEEAVEDSSGNAGASLAAYAARAGLRLKVFCPASASPGKLLQIRLYGAELVPVEGPRPRATEALLEYVSRTGAVYASHLWHPLFIEGVKTLAFEMVEQLDWQAPGTVLCPVGAGSILLGLHQGFSELRQAGIIPCLPRLVAVQARQVSPLHQAFHQGAGEVARAPDPQPTLAEGIALPAPVRGKALLGALRESGGTVIAVEEEEIAAGVRQFGSAGFCVEPTSAVVWPGVERLAREGTSAGPVVAVLSGHGLKAAQPISQLLN